MKKDILKKVRDNYKKILVTLFVFVVFFTMYRIIPMMYDGWAGKYYYPNHDGMLSYINYVFTGFYNWINGRIASNIICGFLESFPTEIPLDLFNAITMSGMVICIDKILKNNNQKKFIFASLLFMSTILLISKEMRADVLFYANSAYVTPVFLLLIYYLLYNKLLSKPSGKIILLMSIIGFAIGTWMEHISVGFAITISLITFYLFIKKNSNKWKLLIPTIVTDLGVIFMCLAPGLRKARVVVTNEIPLIDMVKRNLFIFYNDIISSNLLIIILISIIGLILVITSKNKKKIRYIAAVPMTFLLITSLGTYIDSIFNVKTFGIMHQLYPVSIDINQFWIVALMIVLISIVLIYLITISKNKKILTYLSSILIFSLAPMCLTPNTGARISFVGFIILSLITVVLYYEVDFNKKRTCKFLTFVICFISILSVDKMILICRRINDINVKRNSIINEVIRLQELNMWDYDEYVILPFYKKGDVRYQGVVLSGSFHYPYFLQSSGLNPNTKVLFSNSNTIVEANVDGQNLICRIVSELPDDSEIKYIVQYSENDNEYIDIQNTGWVKDNEYIYNTQGMHGYYKFRIFVKQGNVEQEIEGYFDLYIK